MIYAGKGVKKMSKETFAVFCVETFVWKPLHGNGIFSENSGKERKAEKMKYIYQFGIIGGISFVSEVLYVLLPFPVPASVYGLIILLTLLLTGAVKLGQVEEAADWLLKIMPLLFIGPAVGLLTAAEAVRGQLIPLAVMCALSAAGVMIVTSLTAQFLIRRKKGRKNGK